MSDSAHVTYRRTLLDRFLEGHAHLMRGVVVDLGGKKVSKRGAFRPPVEGVARWIDVNTDTATQPDLVADVAAVPLENGVADCVLCCEVLEHVPEPGIVLAEAARLLRSGGNLIVTTPFLYPVHADPHDYARFTPEGLARLLNGFEEVRISPMGGWLGSVGLLLELGAIRIVGSPWRTLGRWVLKAVARFLFWLDDRGVGMIAGAGFANGFGCVAVRAGTGGSRTP